MTVQEIAEALIEVLRLLSSWPMVVLYLTIIFRKIIVAIVPDLGKRVRRISGAGITIDLESSALQELVMFKASDDEIDVPDEIPSEEIVASVDERDEELPGEDQDSLEEALRKLREGSE